MKRSFVITTLLIWSFVAAYGQTPEDIFKLKFPLIGTELSMTPDAELTKEQVAAYRTQYANLEEALKDIEKQRLGVVTETNVKVFNIKELKDMGKDEMLTKVEALIQKNYSNIKLYMKDKTLYGADSIQCIENLSILKTLTDQKDYSGAYKHFKLLFDFYPISSTNVYSKGEDILEYKMKEAHNKAAAESKKGETADNEIILGFMKEKREWFDTLQMLYDQRIQYFGDNSKYGKGYILGLKGSSYYKNYKKEAFDTAYIYMKESVQLEMENSGHTVIMYYFASGIDMLRNEKIGAEEIIEDYILADKAIQGKIAQSEAYVAKYPDKPQSKTLVEKAIPAYNQISDMITENFIKCPCSSCEVLDSLFSVKFPENKENIEWLRKSTDLLRKKGCKESQFYEDAVVQTYKLEPSADAAFEMAQHFLKKGDYEQAAKYYEEAYTQETDSLVKSKYLYGGAVLARLQNQYGKARSLALQAANHRSGWGEPYILIGKMYAASAGSCGSDNFEQLCTYWVAYDKMATARNIDSSPEVQAEASKYMSIYSGKFPNGEEGFMREIKAGDSYTVGCWINETTTVRY